MNRVEEVDLGHGRQGLRFHCIPCKGFHIVPTKLEGDEIGESYEWNGNSEWPTIVPPVQVPGRCNVSILEGYARYHMSCAHQFRGHEMLLPVIVTPATA